MPKKSKNNINIDNIIENTFSHIKDIVDANTVVGEIIHITKDVSIVPISKISVGMVSGGGNISNKKNNISAGSGTGFNVEPIGFVAINSGILDFLPVHNGDDFGISLIENIVKMCERYLDSNGATSDEK